METIGTKTLNETESQTVELNGTKISGFEKESFIITTPHIKDLTIDYRTGKEKRRDRRKSERKLNKK